MMQIYNQTQNCQFFQCAFLNRCIYSNDYLEKEKRPLSSNQRQMSLNCLDSLLAITIAKGTIYTDTKMICIYMFLVCCNVYH